MYMFIKILDANNTVSQMLLKSSAFIMIPVWILPLTCARHTIIIKSKICLPHLKCNIYLSASRVSQVTIRLPLGSTSRSWVSLKC